MPDDNEDMERRRQAYERGRQSPNDRLYDNPPRISESGQPDGRSSSKRRKGRVIPVPLRVHPRINAILRLILDRGPPDNVPDLFEDMIEAYLKIRTDVDQSELPSDEELIETFLDERSYRLGKP